MSPAVCWDAALAVGLGLLTGGLLAVASHALSRFRAARRIPTVAFEPLAVPRPPDFRAAADQGPGIRQAQGIGGGIRK